MNSKIEITMNGGGKPVAIITYKGKFLIKTPVNLAIKSLLAQKPKLQNKTYQERLAWWEQKVRQTIARQVLGTLAKTLYGDELNADTDVVIDW